MIVTFIPAAGASSRMGGKDKLLEKVGGVPILRKTAIEALGASLGPVVVGLRTKDRERRKALRNLPVTILEVKDADEGMAATLRAGAAYALKAISDAYPTGGDYEYFGMLVMLPDMPDITRDDLLSMDHAFQSSGGPIVRATAKDGKHGHPVLFPDHVVREFEGLRGDKGAAGLLQNEPVVEVILPGERATRDLDTPEDWAEWRTSRQE